MSMIDRGGHLDRWRWTGGGGISPQSIDRPERSTRWSMILADWQSDGSTGHKDTGKLIYKIRYDLSEDYPISSPLLVACESCVESPQ